MDAAARRRVRERLRARRSGADRPKGPTAAELEAEKAQRVLGLKRLLLDKVAGKERHVGRGLKRVLSQFDADRSGELEMPEFTRALEHYLNGIHEDDVRALAEDFDRDGSGSISIEEFIAAFSELQNEAPSTPAPAPPMLRRSAARTAPAPGPRTATSPQQDPDALGLFRPSPPAARAPPPIAPAAPAPPRAPAARAPPRAPSEAGSYRPLNAVADSAEQRLERFGSAARLLLLQRVSADDRQRVRGSRAGALAAGDRLSLHRNAHMKELFRREVRRIFSRSSGGAVTMSDSLPIDAFAAAMGQMTPSGQKSCLDTGAGDVELLWEMSDGSAGGFAEVLLRLPEASAATADGPFPRDPLASRNVAEDQRIRYRFCRTPVYPPSGWDVRAGVRRSQRRPSAQLGLRHAFGYRSDRQGQNLFATADGLLVTTVAGCGIVQDVESGAQRFFRGHDDDISCLDVTVDAKDPRTVVSDVLLDKFAQRTRGALRGQRFHLCATGQMGADPYCCVWLAQRPPPGGGGECVELCRFGARPDLMRMVCAVAFAPSARIVVAIGCDEKHTACLYGLACGDGVALLAQVPTANGEPPQIHDVAFNHSPSGGAAEEFVTCGKRHLKFWTVRREGAALRREGALPLASPAAPRATAAPQARRARCFARCTCAAAAASSRSAPETTGRCTFSGTAAARERCKPARGPVRPSRSTATRSSPRAATARCAASRCRASRPAPRCRCRRATPSARRRARRRWRRTAAPPAATARSSRHSAGGGSRRRGRSGRRGSTGGWRTAAIPWRCASGCAGCACARESSARSRSRS